MWLATLGRKGVTAQLQGTASRTFSCASGHVQPQLRSFRSKRRAAAIAPTAAMPPSASRRATPTTITTPITRTPTRTTTTTASSSGPIRRRSFCTSSSSSSSPSEVSAAMLATYDQQVKEGHLEDSALQRRVVQFLATALEQATEAKKLSLAGELSIRTDEYIYPAYVSASAGVARVEAEHRKIADYTKKLAEENRRRMREQKAQIKASTTATTTSTTTATSAATTTATTATTPPQKPTTKPPTTPKTTTKQLWSSSGTP
mmetsp:Transcript_50556/g.109093  ORF Transcript_50556/g.109093 Transcript_50556/m.109093 type:complete len:260 (-) Transcript_50556:144-923(-)